MHHRPQYNNDHKYQSSNVRRDHHRQHGPNKRHKPEIDQRSPLCAPYPFLHFKDRYDLRRHIPDDVFTAILTDIRLDEPDLATFASNASKNVLTLQIHYPNPSNDNLSKDFLDFISNSTVLEEISIKDEPNALLRPTHWKQILESASKSKSLECISLTRFSGNIQDLNQVIVKDWIIRELKAQNEDLSSQKQNFFQHVIRTSESLSLIESQINPADFQLLSQIIEESESRSFVKLEIDFGRKTQDLSGFEADLDRLDHAMVKSCFRSLQLKSEQLIFNEEKSSKSKEICQKIGFDQNDLNNDESTQSKLKNYSSELYEKYGLDKDVIGFADPAKIEFERIGLLQHLNTPFMLVQINESDSSSAIVQKIMRCLENICEGGFLVAVGRCKNQQTQNDIESRISALFHAQPVGLQLKSYKYSSNSSFNDNRGGDVDSVVEEGPQSEQKNVFVGRNLFVWRRIGTCLTKEYGRFLQHKLLVAEFSNILGFQDETRFQGSKDVVATLEQWFMLRANGEDADTYPIKTLVEEKKICTMEECKEWLRMMNRLVLEIPRVPKSFTKPKMSPWTVSSSNGGPRLNVTLFSVGSFSETLQPERGEALMMHATRLLSKRRENNQDNIKHRNDQTTEKQSIDQVKPKEDDLMDSNNKFVDSQNQSHSLELLLMMLLRYASVFGNFRQFCCSDELFQDLVDKGGNCEGFASPFNAQILISKPPPGMILANQDVGKSVDSNEGDDLYWNPTFCSCYPDSDAPFGAIGSVFNQSFQSGKIGVINPPTVESILADTVIFLEDQMRRQKTKFILILPAWDDLEAQTLVKKSPFLKSSKRLNSNMYPSVNPYTGEKHRSRKEFDLFELSSIE